MIGRITEADIESYPSLHPKVKEWFGTLKLETQRLYTIRLIAFERTTHLQIEELLSKVENSQIRPTEIRTLIVNAASDLRNASQVQMESAVRSLLKYYGGTSLPKSYFHYEEKDFKRGYTKSELNALLGYLDKPLEKLYVIAGAESGLRADTILLLNWKHIEQDFHGRTDSIALRFELPFYIGRKKAGRTFIGQRSRHLVKSCVETGLIKTRSEEHLFQIGRAHV